MTVQYRAQSRYRNILCGTHPDPPEEAPVRSDSQAGAAYTPARAQSAARGSRIRFRDPSRGFARATGSAGGGGSLDAAGEGTFHGAFVRRTQVARSRPGLIECGRIPGEVGSVRSPNLWPTHLFLGFVYSVACGRSVSSSNGSGTPVSRHWPAMTRNDVEDGALRERRAPSG